MKRSIFLGLFRGSFFSFTKGSTVGKSKNDVRGFTSGGLGVNLGGARYFCPLLGGEGLPLFGLREDGTN